MTVEVRYSNQRVLVRQDDCTYFVHYFVRNMRNMRNMHTYICFCCESSYAQITL